MKRLVIFTFSMFYSCVMASNNSLDQCIGTVTNDTPNLATSQESRISVLESRLESLENEIKDLKKIIQNSLKIKQEANYLLI